MRWKTKIGIVLDRHAGIALHQQLYDSFRIAIRRGDLLPGEVLPSSRALAKGLRISRNTVVEAYEALALDGFIAGKLGSCTRVAGPPPIKLPDPDVLIRHSKYPRRPVRFQDPEGNILYLQSTE